MGRHHPAVLFLLLIFSSTSNAEPSRRVIDGQDVQPGYYPFNVRVVNEDNSLCTGSLISPNWVLTAAHCVFPSGVDHPDDVLGYAELRIGYQDSSDVSETPTQLVEYAYDIIPHPDYIRSSLENDYALIQLWQPVTTIPPVALIDEPEYEAPGTEGMLLGWGRTSSTDPDSRATVLQAGETVVREDSTCAEHPSHLCFAGESGATICNGDSGGPLVTGRPGRWRQIGVNSFGTCHPDDAAGAARVSSVTDWIYDTMVKHRCPSEPVSGCATAPSNSLRVRFDVNDPRRNALSWMARRATPPSPGSPEVDDDFAMCIYDAVGLIHETYAPAGGRCGDRNCWRTRSSGQRVYMSDRAAKRDGVRSLIYRRDGGDYERRDYIRIRMRGPEINPMFLPVFATEDQPLRVQAHTSEPGSCVESRFSPDQIRRSRFDRVDARN